MNCELQSTRPGTRGAADLESALRNCLAAAVLAPSGDNVQPWRFELDSRRERITVFVDESRDTSPMNAGQTMSRIACGAAVENMLVEATAHGLIADVEEGDGRVAAHIRVSPGGIAGPESAHRSAAIRARCSNRKFYDARPISSEILEKLRASTPVLDGVATHWICEREKLDALAGVMGTADALMFGENSMRKAFLSNMRFDRPATEPVESGLSLSSLELSTPNRIAMQMMRSLPGAIIKACGGPRLFSAHARKLVASASGLCVVAAPDSTDRSYFRTGRAMQRAWLTLTEHRFAVQPMMSLVVLANTLDRGNEELVASLGLARTHALLERSRAMLALPAGGRPLFVLRFGTAMAPSGRTGRLNSPVRVSDPRDFSR